MPPRALTTLAKAVCVTAALGLVLFMASAARLTIDGLREDTRSSTLTLRTSSQAPAAKTHVRALTRRVVQAPPLEAASPVVYVAPLVLPRAVLRLLAPGGARTFDDDDVALGTGSLPKSAKWIVLGGHGRHGAG